MVILRSIFTITNNDSAIRLHIYRIEVFIEYFYWMPSPAEMCGSGSYKRDSQNIAALRKDCGSFVDEKLRWVLDVIENKLDPRQFGCLRGKSTTHALVDMIHHWFSALDNSKYVRVLFVDYAKAFDHVDHSTVVRKLINFGVPDFLTRDPTAIWRFLSTEPPGISAWTLNRLPNICAADSMGLYLCRRLASGEYIVTLGVCHAVTPCVC